MPVLMLVVALVILAGVVVVASGRGGELAPEYPDYPPIDLGPVTAADVALLRPPSAAWGYNMRVTDEALETISRAVTERDVKISALQQEVSNLREELAQDWTRGSVPPETAAGGDPGADAGAEGPQEGPGLAQPAWPPGEEHAAAGTETPWPPWAQPEAGEPGTAEPHWAGPETADPERGVPGAALPQVPLPQVTPPQAPIPQAPSYPEPSYPEPSYEEPSYERSSHDEPSYEEPSHQDSSHDGSAYGAVQHPAWDGSDDEGDWDEPHQTLVWGVAHQQAKASRLQEQEQAKAGDMSAADAPHQDTPAEDPRSQDPRSQDPRGEDPRGEDPRGEDTTGEDTTGEDTPSADAPRADWPARDTPSEDTPAEDTRSQDTRGEDTTGPKTGHWAEVTAPARYEEAWPPSQAEQDRE